MKTVLVADTINKISSSAYFVESFELWYARSGHVNCGPMKCLLNMSVVHNFVDHGHNKYEICVEVKHFRNLIRPFLIDQLSCLN